MRKVLLAAVAIGGVGLFLAAGTALASAKDSRDDARSSAGFELEIDPDLDAKFGPRPVNAVRAAAIITQSFPGARVLEAELDERGGSPIWEMEFSLNGKKREVDVSAVNGNILQGDD
ncbi:PepSY domain-containing protein [Actinoplanes sp. NEAU-A12]|uniref:PepSY domain-containing protein n=1 Tax=Actinoplanes sandaracinus TaxID=3045177 RepID=A0ABT6WXI4_9ACTN|nr:PepSY domain-containing protein [Actinoplanes sandaracinus]MDI6104316.1 PepSY domain-containing protein [Actinoplanes sandaracinus]